MLTLKNLCVWLITKMPLPGVQGSENGDFEEIRREETVLSKPAPVCWIPIGDRAIGVLSLSSRVGPVES